MKISSMLHINMLTLFLLASVSLFAQKQKQAPTTNPNSKSSSAPAKQPANTKKAPLENTSNQKIPIQKEVESLRAQGKSRHEQVAMLLAKAYPVEEVVHNIRVTSQASQAAFESVVAPQAQTMQQLAPPAESLSEVEQDAAEIFVILYDIYTNTSSPSIREIFDLVYAEFRLSMRTMLKIINAKMPITSQVWLSTLLNGLGGPFKPEQDFGAYLTYSKSCGFNLGEAYGFFSHCSVHSSYNAYSRMVTVLSRLAEVYAVTGYEVHRAGMERYGTKASFIRYEMQPFYDWNLNDTPWGATHWAKVLHTSKTPDGKGGFYPSIPSGEATVILMNANIFTDAEVINAIHAVYLD